MTRFAPLDTPIGRVLIAGTDALTHIRLPGGAPGPDWHEDPDAFPEARARLGAYLAGEPIDLDLPLAPEGTPFQRRVWEALRAIPRGRTASYADIARAIGQPTATRAVGAANGRNPLPIVIPCHRVIAADGSIGGFSGPMGVKRALLTLEGALAQPRLI